MMLNSSQNMDAWQEFFDHPKSSRLGLMNNAYNIGSIISFFFVPYLADWFGRKLPIAIGCVIMIGGGLLSTFSNDWAGKMNTH